MTYFAIRLDSRDKYYTERSPYCWTAKLLDAKAWEDRSIPEAIIERWNHTRQEKDGYLWETILCGESVRNRLDIVEACTGSS